MTLHDRARQLADSGRHSSARSVIWTLFKEGYADAPAEIGFLRRLELDRMCRAAIERAPILRRSHRRS